jgi:hypothetical protein
MLMLFYFFQLGVLLSLARAAKKPGKRIFAAWFLSIFVFTSLVHPFGPGKPPHINHHFQTILDKYKTIIKFEKEVEKKYGKLDSRIIEIERKIIEYY